MCKKIGAIDDLKNGELKIKSLDGLNDQQCANAIAQHFASVSNQYEPVDFNQLPAFLPALPAPQMEEHEIYLKLKRLKNTKSTLPVDLPNKLRNEVMVELAAPMTNIINTCLSSGSYPALWKREWVTPVPKVKDPDLITDVRKIAGTSDFNKVLESCLKDILMQDIYPNMDPKQYGGKKGMGTEHMVVALMDRVQSLLDNNNTRSAVLMASADWRQAFDRGDPTKTTNKIIALGLRSSIVPLIIDFMSGRKMSARFGNSESEVLDLVGGFPQGSLIGGDCYLSASNDAADHIPEEDRFRYIDDLEILELIMMSGILQDYNIHAHIPSDIPVDHQYLPASTYQTQSRLDHLSLWTVQNKMLLNPQKCNYLIFSRSQQQFVTRLSVDGENLKQLEAVKILGCWIDQDAGTWSTNTQQLVRGAYARLSMLSKLKYTGVSTEDLLEIYKLFIRSKAEYMSALWHSGLTQEQSNKIENIQKSSLKIILQEMYIEYDIALEISGLLRLSVRRQNHCLTFAKRCLLNKQTAKMFPINPEAQIELRHTEKFQVNFAHTENYKNSAVPYCQRLLNQDAADQREKEQARRFQQQAGARGQEMARGQEQEEQEEGRARRREGH
jgi:hypothetical protein